MLRTLFDVMFRTTKLSVVIHLLCFSIVAQFNKKFQLEPEYDFHEIPPTNAHEEAPMVEASLNLRNILEVLETQQLISIETSLRLYWRDTRIKPVQKFLEMVDSCGPYMSLNLEIASTIWMPDIFIDKTKSIRKPTYFSQAALLRIYNNSIIKYSARFNFDVACPMGFHRFFIITRFDFDNLTF